MKGFIRVRASVSGYGDNIPVLVGVRNIWWVVCTSWGCEIRCQDSTLQVSDSFEDVVASIALAEGMRPAEVADIMKVRRFASDAGGGDAL